MAAATTMMAGAHKSPIGPIPIVNGMRTILCFACLLLTTTAARADTVTIDPLIGAVGFSGKNLGDWALGYERRLSEHHAVLVEPTGVHVHSDPWHLTLLGIGAGYRYHLRPRDGGFVGAIAGAKVGFGRFGDMDLGARAVFTTAHVGWRWISDDGVTVTARIGAGVAAYRLDDGAPAEAEAMRDDRLAPLPFELDGELGVGWSF
jgi:hypothetical protein